MIVDIRSQATTHLTAPMPMFLTIFPSLHSLLLTQNLKISLIHSRGVTGSNLDKV